MTAFVCILVVSIIVQVILNRLFGPAGHAGNLGIESAALADCTDLEASELSDCSGLATSSDGASDCTKLEASELADCSGLGGIEINFF